MPDTRIAAAGRTAAVTGAGGGLGRETALGLGAKGYRVFGTALEPAEVADLKEASGGAVALTVCDITDESAVKSWAREVGSRRAAASTFDSERWDFNSRSPGGPAACGHTARVRGQRVWRTRCHQCIPPSLTTAARAHCLHQHLDG